MVEYARRGFQRVDPTIRHLRRYHTPYIWDARVPPSADTVPFFKFLMTTSVCCGVVVPLGLSGERLWVLSVSRSQFAPFIADVLRVLPVYGHAAKAIYESVDAPHAAAAEAADLPLSEQQLRFLRWAAEGKSSTDIATITGQPRRTIEYHFSEILRKLQVATRAQAIAQLPDLSGTSWRWSTAGAHSHDSHF
jgi:DNA-binding CsgD family transcriptional regulator